MTTDELRAENKELRRLLKETEHAKKMLDIALGAALKLLGDRDMREVG